MQPEVAMESKVSIRLIEAKDNEALASVIKRSLEHIGAAIPGTVYTDEATNHMSLQYQEARSAYFIAEENGEVLGGCGIKQLPGLDKNICELQRMFLRINSRGRGIASTLMEKCLEFAKAEGFEACYLETMPKMKAAISLYSKYGFERLNQAMGETGHFSCDVWMLKKLNSN